VGLGRGVRVRGTGTWMEGVGIGRLGLGVAGGSAVCACCCGPIKLSGCVCRWLLLHQEKGPARPAAPGQPHNVPLRRCAAEAARLAI
jgi:hypothetical protein